MPSTNNVMNEKFHKYTFCNYENDINYLLQKIGVIRCTALEERIYCELRRVVQEIELLLITFKISAFALINFSDFNKINKIKRHFK